MSSDSNVFSSSKYVKVISYIILTISTLIVLYPILFLLFTSVKDTNGFYTNPFLPTRDVHLENYPAAISTGKLGLYFSNSVIVSIFSVVLTLAISILGGYALGKMRIPGSEIIILAFMTFNFIPGIAIYIPLYKMLANMHMLNNIFSIIMPYVAWQIPFSMYIFKKYFETVPSDLIESGRIDGCGEFNTFYKIVLPLVKPAVATVVVFAFINNWGELMWAQIVTASSVTLKTLPVGLLNFKTEMGVQWGPYAAGLCLVTIPLLVVFGFCQKYFIAGLTQGAVKG